VTVAELDRLSETEVAQAFERCCGSRAWVAGMLARRPFGTVAELLAASEAVWRGIGPADCREAFAHHPRIGDLASLRTRFASTAAWAAGEQAGASGASEATLARLAEGNRTYEEKFGYIFIVCATGRSAAEMLSLLEQRLPNDPQDELRVAAAEQAKITRLRLEKLVSESR
jgi:2-oxo-4-hydroxy-4-carboxy-5-ureidoimidazoline decarboxylase